MTTQTISKRMHFVDYVRVMLTVLVIAHHAGAAYGPTGGGWPVSNLQRTPLLGPFFGVNPMFFMGLFFLLAGYFVPAAYERKGAAAFIKGRLVRLGLPVLVFALFVFGPVAYLGQDRQRSFAEFIAYHYENGWQQIYVHLWFLVHLLVYSLGYALWRRLIKRRSPAAQTVPRPPTHLTLAAFALALAVITWVVRIWYPLDRWVPFLFVIPSEIAHLPQYIIMFALGIVAYRGDWLRRLPTATGLVWLGIGLTATVAYYVCDLRVAAFRREIIATGGMNWRSAVFCAWEALVCTGLCVGLLVLFRERLNRQPGKLTSAIVGAAYAAYIIHLPLVLGVQAGLDGVALPPFIKFALVTLVVTILSFGIGHLLRQIPDAKKIL